MTEKKKKERDVRKKGIRIVSEKKKESKKEEKGKEESLRGTRRLIEGKQTKMEKRKNY